MKDIDYKYAEDKVLDEIADYINSTYDEHYVGNNGVQTIDVWDSLNIADKMCQGTSIKYLMRFGKKDGYNRKDLLKTIHYAILLMYFADQQEDQ